MRYRSWLLALFAAFAALSAEKTLACSCAEPGPVRDVVQRTPVIFTGTAINEEILKDERGRERAVTTFSVDQYVKGSGPNRLVVGTMIPSGLCGYRFRRSEPITVFARSVASEDGRGAYVVTDACTMGLYLQQQTQTDALLGRFREEADRLANALANGPATPALLLEKASLLEHLNDARAVVAYTNLISGASGLVPAYLGLARLALRAGDVKEANRRLDQILTFNPAEPEVARLRVHARLRAGDLAALEDTRDLRGLELVSSTGFGMSLDASWRDLRGMDLRDARIDRFVAHTTDLRGARFNGATFRNADLTGADLRGADLANLSVRALDLTRARLDENSLSGLALARVTLAGASLRHVSGQDVDLRGANLSRSDLRGARLPGARLHRASLRNANLSDTILVGADLSWTNLAGADLTGANIRGATFDLAFYDCRTRLPRGLTPEALGMVPEDPANARCR